MPVQPERVESLFAWLRSQGGNMHDSLAPRIDPTTGLSIYANEPIETDTILLSCPFELVITPARATYAICEHMNLNEEKLKGWNERMRIAAYLCLHLLSTGGLGHQAYVDALPPPADLSSPLFFSPSELELLSGTNLYPAVVDRRREWEAEYEIVKRTLEESALEWIHYLAAATCITSRAFPSKLLSIPAEGQTESRAVDTSEEEESHPVLIPGMDMFNHARAQPITWLSSYRPQLDGEGSTPCISLVSASLQEKDKQIFNNYGPKSNEELLLSYGFVLDDNPDDTVILRLGPTQPPKAAQNEDHAQNQTASTQQRFTLRRNGIPPKDLLSTLRKLLGPEKEEIEPDEEDEHALIEFERRGFELDLDVLGELGGMLEDRLRRLVVGGREVDGVEKEEGTGEGEGEVREEIRRMCEVYRRGQVEILEATMDTIAERIERLEQMIDQGMGGCACCS